MNKFKEHIFKKRTNDGIIFYTFYLSSISDAVSANVCPYIYNLQLYSNVSNLTNGSIIYIDNTLTTPFNGGSLYRHINMSHIYGKSIRIDGNGVVLSIENPCYPLFFQVMLSNSSSISNCQGANINTFPIQTYVQETPIILGTTFYTDSSLTNIFIGDGTWYSVNIALSYRINSSGVVTEISDCT